jgi:hypothetical protein
MYFAEYLSDVKNYFIPTTQAVGVEGVKWHSLRHSCASLVAIASVEICKQS